MGEVLCGLQDKLGWCSGERPDSKKEKIQRETKRRKDKAHHTQLQEKTAINNLHHLSLRAPLDHSTNSTRNLRQKHTLTHMLGRAHTERKTCMRAQNLHEHTRALKCNQLHRHTHTRATLQPAGTAQLPAKSKAPEIKQQHNGPLLSFLVVVSYPNLDLCLSESESLQEACSSQRCLLSLSRHVKFMQCMSLRASTQQ